MTENQAGSIVYLGKAAPTAAGSGAGTGDSSSSASGFAPQRVINAAIVKEGNKCSLTWRDPADTVIENQIICAWAGTLIVRKTGSYPADPTDGTVVLDNKTRNAYAQTPFVDTVPDATADYKYRAFPYSANGVFNLQEQNRFGKWVFTFKELMSESSPAHRIVYADDCANYTPAKMDFTSDVFDWGDWQNNPLVSLDYIRPCMLYNDDAGADLKGKVAYYLDPNDHTKKYGTGEASDVANPDFPGNAMVQVRRVFRKIVVDGNTIIKSFSNDKLDDDYECFSCKKSDGTYADFFYVPMFPGSFINNKVRSLSGQTVMQSKTAAQEIAGATANGAGWYTEVLADNQYFEDLFKLLFGTTNGQSALGEGVSTGEAAALKTTGTTVSKGMMYGASTTNVAVKFCYMEHWWAHQWRRFGGLIFKNGVRYVKLTASTVDGSTAEGYNTTGDGYIQLDLPAPSGSSGGYISKIQQAGKHGCFPTVMSGSESTYLCDGCWFNNGIVAYPFRGGGAGDGRLCGPFALDSNNTATHAYWYLSAALSYHP